MLQVEHEAGKGWSQKGTYADRGVQRTQYTTDVSTAEVIGCHRWKQSHKATIGNTSEVELRDVLNSAWKDSKNVVKE